MDEVIDGLWTRTTGRGEPLLLCHGGPGLWSDFDALAAMVEDVVTVRQWDQRGCGRSRDAGDGTHTIARYVADMEMLRERWGHERWIVGGHSWGASLALHYAHAHPHRVRALVYVSGTGIGREWKEAYRAERLRRLGAHAARWIDLRSRERTPEQDREYAQLTWSTDFADRGRALELAAALLGDGSLVPNYACNAALNAETEALAEDELAARSRFVDAPALLLHGTLDPRPISALGSLLEALPRARLAPVDGAGHYPWLERPAAVREALRSFLASLPAD